MVILGNWLRLLIFAFTTFIPDFRLFPFQFHVRCTQIEVLYLISLG